MYPRITQTSARQSATLFLLLLTSSLLALVSGLLEDSSSFCGHSHSGEQRRAVQLDRYSTRFKRFADSSVRNSRAKRNHHQLEKQANQYHEEHHIVIDHRGGNTANLPAEHRQFHLTTETRIAADDQRQRNGNSPQQTNCRSGLAKSSQTSDRRQGQQQPKNSDNSYAQSDDCDDQKTIETAVFIDQALDNRFNGQSNGLVELNKLVLTIMNQVQHLFHYSSLKVPIRIKLVLVEHMRDSERQVGIAAPNPERGDIDAYLSNFCNWQQTRLEKERRIRWDHAILLSGLDLYKATPGKNHSGVLGLAWVGGMCKGNYSCTINEASNLESAFVIAHEIGHSLGIMHDGQRNNCDPNGFIMSERTGAGKVHWSRCSNNYLNDSINRKQLACLDTEQNSVTDPLYDLSKLRMPGQVYSINDQCKLAFGNNHTSFVTRSSPFNGVCRELWCVAGNWAKAAHPALEGSACGDQDRVCLEGKCTKH